MPDGRQALIRAGIQAFANAGFDAADIRGIAAAAGVSPNLVRVHFGSKAELWEACLDVVAGAAVPVMAHVARLAGNAGKPLYERLHDVVVAVAAFYGAHPEVRDFVTRHGAESPERAAMLTERLLRPAYETVRGVFAAGIAAGIVRSDHPALFFALVNGALGQPTTFPTLLGRLAPEIDVATARARMNETVIATLLHRPILAPSGSVDAGWAGSDPLSASRATAGTPGGIDQLLPTKP